MTPRRVFAAVLVAAWALDVATKVWAAASLTERTIALLGGRLMLRESRNTGAAFSIGTSQTVAISLISIAIVAVILRHVRTVTSTAVALALGLIAGGAIGNLTDRLLRDPGPLRGGVVDWIDLGWFPSFNAADSAITVGVALLLVSFRADPPPATCDEAAQAASGFDVVLKDGDNVVIACGEDGSFPTEPDASALKNA